MKKNLILQLARFGDLIQTKRLALSLQAEGELHLALDESLVALASRLYPGAVLHPIKAHGGGGAAEALALNAKAFAALRAENFDAVYNLNRNAMSLALSGLFAPERVRGYRLDGGQALASTWTKMAARWTSQRRFAPINLVDFWAFFHENPLEPGKVNPIARAKNRPGEGQGQRIGVALSGRESRRSLPPAVLAQLLDALFAARKGPRLVLLGSKSESAHARLLLRGLSPQAAGRAEDLSGKTSLADLHEIVEGLDLLVTPDTGLMHLAAHLGVPVLATFLSSAWAWETGPYGLGHIVWQSLEPCSPCLESAPCPHKTVCLGAFRSPDWLGHLAGRNSGAWPHSLLGLVSTLDDLGVSYLCVDGGGEGEDFENERRERLARRAFLSEYLGLLPLGRRPALIAPHVAEEFLSLSDWTLPEYLG